MTRHRSNFLAFVEGGVFLGFIAFCECLAKLNLLALLLHLFIHELLYLLIMGKQLLLIKFKCHLIQLHWLEVIVQAIIPNAQHLRVNLILQRLNLRRQYLPLHLLAILLLVDDAILHL